MTKTNSRTNKSKNSGEWILDLYVSTYNKCKQQTMNYIMNGGGSFLFLLTYSVFHDFIGFFVCLSISFVDGWPDKIIIFDCCPLFYRRPYQSYVLSPYFFCLIPENERKIHPFRKPLIPFVRQIFFFVVKKMHCLFAVYCVFGESSIIKHLISL